MNNKNIITLFVIILVSTFLVGCSSNVVEENTKDDEGISVGVTQRDDSSSTTAIDESGNVIMPDTPPIEVLDLPESEGRINVEDVQILCESQCKKDSELYCLEKKELVLSDDETTVGTCRSFGKYRKEFSKCSGFCEKYGEEEETTQGCELIDGTKDSNCDGK